MREFVGLLRWIKKYLVCWGSNPGFKFLLGNENVRVCKDLY
jgi:hypothetical protein